MNYILIAAAYIVLMFAFFFVANLIYNIKKRGDSE